MRHAFLPFMIAAALIVSAAAPASAQQEFADEVNASIESAVNFLLNAQRPDGSWQEYEDHEDKHGMTPLVVYALIEAGVSPQSEPILKALTYIDEQGPLSMTYGIALRAVALQVANEQTNDRYFRTFQGDVAYLLGSPNGRYHYQEMGGSAWDNSNGQYAVLGVRAGAENGRLNIPRRYWEGIQAHWWGQQNGDGGWGYYDGDPYVQAPDGRFYYGNATQATMTVGGIATLYICEDNVPPSQAIINCNNVQMDPHIARGLQWLNQNFRWTLDRPHQMLEEWYYYYLYGVERAALASGYKYFGGIDWYRAGVQRLRGRQSPGGAWAGATDGPGAANANTAFALLFLIRGHQPLLFNKLQFNGDWNNRSRDLASATRWLSRTYEHSVNWQIATLGSPLDDWRDAPILYISGKGPVSFTPLEAAKLREYVYQGGTILSVAECNGPEFNRSIREFYRQAFPHYSLEACSPDHRLYGYPNSLDPQELHLFELSNGVRPLAIHVENDLALAWQRRQFARERWAFQATANIVLYAVENLIDLPARGVNLWPAGQDAAFVGSPGGAGGGVSVDWIYLMSADGQIAPVEGSAVGQQVQFEGQNITIPPPDASGRTIVYAEETGEYISVPDELVGQMIPTPSGAMFVAQPRQDDTPAPAPVAVVTPPPRGGAADVTVIRLQNANDAANCNPEPRAWLRFAALMGDRVRVGVAVVGPIDITDLPNQASAHNAKLAVLTGSRALTLTEEEQEAIKQFIASGGTLFIDAAGGSVEFTDSVKELVRQMYGRTNRLRDMATTAPVFNLSGHEINSVEYRVRTAEHLLTNAPRLQASFIDDRPAIIFSAEDVTTGLVGFNSGAFDGYAPESAFAIMRNIVLSKGR